MKFKKIISLFLASAFLTLNFKTAIFAHEKPQTYAETSISQSVFVDNKNMSVCIKGSGDKTVVILSGWGTESPIEDFAELADKLSDTYRVVIVEYFGYGKSDDTEKERTSENIIEETRTALKNLNITPPYILMPHSISGIHSLWYAENYPNEIESIIEVDASKANNMVEYFESHENCLKNDPPSFRDKNTLNNALLGEFHMFFKNSEKFWNAKYPKNLPVLSFIASGTIDALKDGEKSYQSGNELTGWFELHQNMISNPEIQKNIILQGGHWLYREPAVEEIAQRTKEFIENISKKKNINLDIRYSKHFDLVLHVLAYLKIGNASNLYDQSYINKIAIEKQNFSYDIASEISSLEKYYNDNFERLAVINFLPVQSNNFDEMKNLFLNCNRFTS